MAYVGGSHSPFLVERIFFAYQVSDAEAGHFDTNSCTRFRAGFPVGFIPKIFTECSLWPHGPEPWKAELLAAKFSVDW